MELPQYMFKISDTVVEVGLRAKILSEANKRRLRVAVRNLSGSEVEVVVAGSQSDINNFYDAVCSFVEGARCSALEKYPYAVDWEANYQGFVAEQMAKFVDYGRAVLHKLDDIDSKLDRLNNKMDSLGNKMDRGFTNLGDIMLFATDHVPISKPKDECNIMRGEIWHNGKCWVKRSRLDGK